MNPIIEDCPDVRAWGVPLSPAWAPAAFPSKNVSKSFHPSNGDSPAIITSENMLGLGLGLKLDDFTRVFKAPKDFFVGFISQLIILPIVAYLLIIILRTPPEIAIGVMIIAAAPGGVTSNIMTKFADGDVALSISLTAVISLISIITVPLIIFTSADLLGVTEVSQNISMTGIALKMFLVVTVPVMLGMIIRKFAENFISSKVEIFNKLNIVLFIVFFLMKNDCVQVLQYFDTKTHYLQSLNNPPIPL